MNDNAIVIGILNKENQHLLCHLVSEVETVEMSQKSGILYFWHSFLFQKFITNKQVKL